VGETTVGAVAEHWGTGDMYERIIDALGKASIPLESVGVLDLAPVDHLHARGLPATVDLADQLPVVAGQRLLDIGCGLGGPARYCADRFGCEVTGIDLTPSFVAAGNRLTHLVGMDGRVTLEEGDAQRLPYADEAFDGAYSQHVTMNIPNRESFFAEAWRVLKPGGYFGLTEHGLGDASQGRHYPVPWSEDGTGEHLQPPERTIALLESAGFADLRIEHTGPKYIAAYAQILKLADEGRLPRLGLHVIIGPSAMEKAFNSKRNIEEGRTDPIQVVCHKPA
jgi:ubiquinone/menaquinone biosynthesis C-methylase UbiE